MRVVPRVALPALLLVALASIAACGGGGGGGGGGGAPPSSNANLSGLGVSAGALSPGFAQGVTNYTVQPSLLQAFVQVTPVVAVPGSSITVNGALVVSGSPSAALPLSLGPTTVTLVVTALDGTTTRTYTVVFQRNRSALSAITTSTGPLLPGFDPTSLAYGAHVGMTTATTTVTATSVDPGATILINGVATASGTPSAAITLLPGTTPVTIQVSAPGGSPQTTYTVLFERRLGGQEAYLKASNTGTGDVFGYAVALSGDTLVVGAPWEWSDATGVNGDQGNNNRRDSGAAYVFVRNGSAWTQQAYLKASNTGVSDFFGWSVTISGDTLVVGAQGEGSNATGVNGDQADDNAGFSGAAYVFVRNGTTWSQQAYLKASNTDGGDRFGQSVSLSGDTLVVGAIHEASSSTGVDGLQGNSSLERSGAAYVFVRTGTDWSQQAYLKASNTGRDDWFGWSVAASGDTVAVSAPNERSDATGIDGDQGNDDGNASGAVYVFTRSGTTWSQQAYVKASNTGVEDGFGQCLALSGETLVVGAWKEDSSAVGVNGNQADAGAGDSGAAYVFVRSGTAWSQQAYLKPSNTSLGDNFGFSIALDGDFLVVGAFQEDSGATGLNGSQADALPLGENSGAAYFFVRTGSTWSQQAYLKASNTGAEDQFGYSVALSGVTLAVGALGEDSAATGANGNQADNSADGSGAVYVYR